MRTTGFPYSFNQRLVGHPLQRTWKFWTERLINIIFSMYLSEYTFCHFFSHKVSFFFHILFFPGKWIQTFFKGTMSPQNKSIIMKNTKNLCKTTSAHTIFFFFKNFDECLIFPFYIQRKIYISVATCSCTEFDDIRLLSFRCSDKDFFQAETSVTV